VIETTQNRAAKANSTEASWADAGSYGGADRTRKAWRTDWRGIGLADRRFWAAPSPDGGGRAGTQQQLLDPRPTIPESHGPMLMTGRPSRR